MSMNERKMSGKQTVAGGFDLDRFVGGAAQPEDPREMDAPVSAASKPRRSAVKKPAKEESLTGLIISLTRIFLNCVEGFLLYLHAR